MQVEPRRRESTKAGLQFVQSPLSPGLESVATAIVDAAFKIHSALGPGLLESVYELCLRHELKRRNIDSETQVPIPISYDGLMLDAGLRLDFLEAKEIVLEIKAVEQLTPLFEAQLLKLSGKRLGFLINFNVPRIRDGIRRIVL